MCEIVDLIDYHYAAWPNFHTSIIQFVFKEYFSTRRDNSKDKTVDRQRQNGQNNSQKID